MAKDKTLFTCTVCGATTYKWQGKCFECGSFNTFVEKKITSTKNAMNQSMRFDAPQVVALSSVQLSERNRIKTPIHELDTVLSGGFVPNQVVLIGGEPGVGKSTLLLQLAGHYQSVYVCGEESEVQVKLRAERLDVSSDSVRLYREREVNQLCQYILDEFPIQKNEPATLVIVDSIQSVFSSHIESTPGSISQVQYCTNKLVETAKKSNVIMVIVGQITKEGGIAGPKQLEHLVDTVLYLEGDRKTDLRILRVAKNRFGSTDQVGILEMGEKGLTVADDMVKRLIEDSHRGVPGSVVTVAMEGQRPLLLEVQALNTPAQYGNARRVVNGLSTNRVQMLLAVLQRRVGIKAGNYDIYVNVSGGLKVNDPALDLPIALAVYSVIKNKAFPAETVVYGEVGLLGEVKPVWQETRRQNEAEKRGYKTCVSANFSTSLSGVIKKLFT